MRGGGGVGVFFVVASLAVLVEVVLLSHVLPHDEQNGRTDQTVMQSQREEIVKF